VFALEYGFGEMHAIDFKKGCFIGQEVTSRTHRKGRLRKKLHPFNLDGATGGPDTQDDTLMAGDRQAGQLVALQDRFGLALIREDAVAETLTLNGARITLAAGLFDPTA